MQSGTLKPVSVLLITGICGIHFVLAAPSKTHSIRPGIRTLLKIEKEYIAKFDDENFPLKKGAKVELYLQSGDKLSGAEVADLLQGKAKNTLKSLSVILPKGNKRKIEATSLLHITAEEQTFDVVQDPSAKSFVLLDLERRDELATERLAKTGHSLWTEPTEEERKESIEEARKLFRKVNELFSDREFHLNETKYYLFFTDIPPDQVEAYVANLDAMYQQLCLAFGLLPDRNIWIGKCPIIVFQDKISFMQFERTVMNYPIAENVQGLYHSQPDGNVVVAAYRSSDPSYFGQTLVHETAHGFVHRLRSNVRIESWLNEGIADWIAGVAVPSSNAVVRRRSDAIAQMRITRSMGGFFEPKRQLNATEYGTAASLIDFMLQTDSNLFRAFLMAIKDGYTPQDALRLTFDSTPAELVQSFGASIGVPDLTP